MMRGPRFFDSGECLFDVAYFAGFESYLHVLVYVGLLGAEVDDACGLSHACGYLIDGLS